MSQEKNLISESVQSPQRRTIMKAAAWAAPVVAVASTAPLAAASINSSTFTVSVGSQINADPVGGTASGSLAGALNITNVVGTWETGQLTAYYRFTGPWTTTELTGPFAVGQEFGIWRVDRVQPTGAGLAAREVRFTAPSQTVTAPVSFALPTASYSGTFPPGAPNPFNAINAYVGFVSANGINANNSSSYPTEED